MRRPTTLRALRWWGVVASLLMAVTGFLAGTSDKHGAAWIAGVVIWFPAAGALVWLWLRLRGKTDDLRWLMVTGALWALPFLLAPPLGSHDVYAYACQGQLFGNGFDLYKVGPDALPCSWLGSVPPLWRATPTPYGPLWIALEGAAAWLAGGSLPVVVTLLRVIAIGATLLAVAAGVRLADATGASRADFVRLAAISPLVMVHVVSGAHNDMLLAALVLAGLAVAVRGSPRWATLLCGASFGLAAGVKVTALAAAPFALPMLLGKGKPTPKRYLGTGVSLIASTVVTYAVLAVATGHGVGFLGALGSTSGLVQWLSVPTGVGMAVGYALRVAGLGPDAFAQAVSVTRAIGFVVLAVVLVALWLWALRRRSTGRSVTAAGLALLATALLGPVFYAWYAIGGLAVLAATPLAGRLRTAVTAGAGGLIFLTLPDSLGLATKTKVPGAIFDFALVVVLTVGAVRRLRRRRELRQPAQRSP